MADSKNIEELGIRLPCGCRLVGNIIWGPDCYGVVIDEKIKNGRRKRKGRD